VPELIIANNELSFKMKRKAELIIANKELCFFKTKEKRCS
jgi:hypothetical protein